MEEELPFRTPDHRQQKWPQPSTKTRVRRGPSTHKKERWVLARRKGTADVHDSWEEEDGMGRGPPAENKEWLLEALEIGARALVIHYVA